MSNWNKATFFAVHCMCYVKCFTTTVGRKVFEWEVVSQSGASWNSALVNTNACDFKGSKLSQLVFTLLKQSRFRSWQIAHHLTACFGVRLCQQHSTDCLCSIPCTARRHFSILTDQSIPKGSRQQSRCAKCNIHLLVENRNANSSSPTGNVSKEQQIRTEQVGNSDWWCHPMVSETFPGQV